MRIEYERPEESFDYEIECEYIDPESENLYPDMVDNMDTAMIDNTDVDIRLVDQGFASLTQAEINTLFQNNRRATAS